MTTDFDALWAAVLAAPADNGLKLIAADWLADHDADPDLEAGLRLCAYHGTFPHKTTAWPWWPEFPWRWGTGYCNGGDPWPETAIPPSHLLRHLGWRGNDLGRWHNRTVGADPAQLVRWLAWAHAECQKSGEAVAPVGSTQ